MRPFRQFVNDESAAAATEYGIMLGLIVILVFATIVLLSDSMQAVYASLSTAEEW